MQKSLKKFIFCAPKLSRKATCKMVSSSERPQNILPTDQSPTHMRVRKKWITVEAAENTLHACHRLNLDLGLATLLHVHYNVDFDEITRQSQHKASSKENETTSQYSAWMTQKPTKGNFRELKSKIFPGGHMFKDLHVNPPLLYATCKKRWKMLMLWCNHQISKTIELHGFN